MYKRELANYLVEVAEKYPVVTIIGPRQSGKSTLCRALFKDHQYLSLEETDTRELAIKDPRGFFKKHDQNLVLDEIQRAPELLSFIQTIVDEPKSKRHFVLTGSHQLLLMEKVTQSLAGRTVIAKLLPFSRGELWGRHAKMTIDEFIFSGGYPRIYDKELNPSQWLQQYFQTYVERDVRALINVSNLDQFERFMRLCAGRAGQLLNLSSLANDCGITQPTAKAWLSALQASFICFTLQPHFKNFNKRVIKTPKLYFYDTGLLCYLLKIQSPDVLASHPLRGNIFENWVVSEYEKKYYNQGLEPPLYFWQDAKGHEIDLIIDEGTYLYPIEIKSSYTPNSTMVKNIEYFSRLQKTPPKKGLLGECIYCGDSEQPFKDYLLRPWSTL
ncbi:MAG: ATP-binding protein [bacterium]